jgi:alpha-ketoglutarate-dependent taurine dioxygenase
VRNTGQRSEFTADKVSYQDWRSVRLQSYPTRVQDITVGIGSLTNLGKREIDAINSACKRCNMAIYRCHDSFADRSAVKAFAANFGLNRLDHHLCANADGVSELSVAHAGEKTIYVPYSNRSLSWHTDGYYNDKSRQVNAVVLHCVNSAASGGENALLDPEMVYICLRDADPLFIKALEHPECMTIPANRTAEGEIRSAVQGPVFSYDIDGCIHMRYSARKKNIQWRDDDITRDALCLLSEILNDENGPVFRYRLQAGEGLISNNVLHNRTAFGDQPSHTRLLYRARYFDRIDTS